MYPEVQRPSNIFLIHLSPDPQNLFSLKEELGSNIFHLILQNQTDVMATLEVF